MSKRKSKSSVILFDYVFNDINHWMAEENGENYEIGDNLDELCSKEEEIDCNPSKECLEEEQQSEESEDNLNQQKRYGPRKQVTRNWNVHDIDSSLDDNNYEEIL